MIRLNNAISISTALVLIGLFNLGVEPLHASDEIFKWVDADGTTHFSARPPEGVEYQRINTLTDVTQTVSPQTVGETEASGNEAQAEGAELVPALPEVEVQEPDPELVAERCEQARTNLGWMTQRVRINRENEDGEVERVSEEERQQMIQESQDFIDEWC